MMGELDIGPRPANIPPKEEIVGVTVQDMEVGLKISTTRPCLMLEKVMMLLEEVNLGLGPALPTPTIKLFMINHLFL